MANVGEKIDLNSVVELIVAKYQPDRVILFGSSVTVDIDRFSDVDLMVIKKTPSSFLQRLKELPALPVGVDVIVYTPEEFERMKENENPFILSALENSRVIYEKQQG